MERLAVWKFSARGKKVKWDTRVTSADGKK